MERMRSPLGTAYGLGSAKEGSRGWWQLRVSAVALVPLALWWVVSVALHAGADYDQFVAWVRAPLTSILLILTIVATFWHMPLGIQEVIEDYVHHEGMKLGAILLVRFAAVALAVAGIFSVLRLAFGG